MKSYINEFSRRHGIVNSIYNYLDISLIKQCTPFRYVSVCLCVFLNDNKLIMSYPKGKI